MTYSNATISAPPTTNNANSNNNEGQKSTLITTTGTTSKIIHPPEDLSLEELRARKPKYHRQISTAIASTAPSSSSSSNANTPQTSTITAGQSTCSTTMTTSVAAAISQAQEVKLFKMPLVKYKICSCLLINFSNKLQQWLLLFKHNNKLQMFKLRLQLININNSKNKWMI